MESPISVTFFTENCFFVAWALGAAGGCWDIWGWGSVCLPVAGWGGVGEVEVKWFDGGKWAFGGSCDGGYWVWTGAGGGICWTWTWGNDPGWCRTAVEVSLTVGYGTRGYGATCCCGIWCCFALGRDWGKIWWIASRVWNPYGTAALRRQRLPDAKGVQLWMLIDLIVWYDGTGILGGNWPGPAQRIKGATNNHVAWRKNSHIRHSRAGRALLPWRKECGRLWVQLASAVQAPMHSVAYMYIDSY